MPLFGTFSTMSLPDLLQWLAASAKTGTLRVERNRATKVLRVRDGRVTGSSSDEPALRLGQFLLSQKKITEEQLREALARTRLLAIGPVTAEAVRRAGFEPAGVAGEPTDEAVVRAVCSLFA